MQECAVLLMELMKTSDHRAASIVVSQVVAIDAFGANYSRFHKSWRRFLFGNEIKI